MSDTDRESLQRSLEALCDELQVRRLEADDIVELLSDGEDPAWVAEQAIEEEGEGRTQLQQLLSQMAPLVYTAPEPQEEEDAELEPSDSESSEAAVGAPDDADAPADLQE